MGKLEGETKHENLWTQKQNEGFGRKGVVGMSESGGGY